MGHKYCFSVDMRTTIVCGMLGSGKTTFIGNVLKESKERTVVLVNDFGSAGIDGEILSVDGIDTVELPSGCVCCTLKFDLITTIEKIIKKFDPLSLYIEPSGVASPSGVLEALESLNISNVLVVGIIDATEFIDIYESEMYGNFFIDQVARSDVLLINKTDLTGSGNVERTLKILQEMNGKAIMIPTVNAEMDHIPKHRDNIKKVTGSPCHDVHLSSLSFIIRNKSPLSVLNDLFENLSSGTYGNVVRAKALVHTDEGPFRFDLSFGHLSVEPFRSSITDSRLVVIGSSLNEMKLSEDIDN